MEKNQPPKRGYLSDGFRKKLTSGKQSDILKYILSDPDLDIQLRDNYINMYYKGGNILRMGPQSFQFDKFYFYRRKDGTKPFPKTYVENIAKGKPENISKRTKEPVPSEEEAKNIIESLQEKANALIVSLNTDVSGYFSKAKSIMDAWFRDWEKAERNDQHTIALNNRSWGKSNDLVVLDIEFAVSRNHPYNKARNKKGETKVCRFDIIAVDRNGQIYVIELKQNEVADSEGNKANVNVHTEDFDNTVGSTDAQSFMDEIFDLVKTKQSLQILQESIVVDKSSRPIFAVAYSGKHADDFNTKYRAQGITVVEVVGDRKLLKLK